MDQRTFIWLWTIIIVAIILPFYLRSLRKDKAVLVDEHEKEREILARIPQNARRFEYTRVWITDTTLYLWANRDNVAVYIGSTYRCDDVWELKIADIIKFEKQGEVYHDLELSGGGMSLGGAFIGGVIAGGVGAIIGSRKKIRSEIVENDTRATVITYLNQGSKCESVTAHGVYDILVDLLPEKEGYVVETLRRQKLLDRMSRDDIHPRPPIPALPEEIYQIEEGSDSQNQQSDISVARRRRTDRHKDSMGSNN